jgi:hypothetical protein
LTRSEADHSPKHRVSLPVERRIDQGQKQVAAFKHTRPLERYRQIAVSDRGPQVSDYRFDLFAIELIERSGRDDDPRVTLRGSDRGGVRR